MGNGSERSALRRSGGTTTRGASVGAAEAERSYADPPAVGTSAAGRTWPAVRESYPVPPKYGSCATSRNAANAAVPGYRRQSGLFGRWDQ